MAIRTRSKLSDNEKMGIAVGGVAVLGGIAYEVLKNKGGSTGGAPLAPVNLQASGITSSGATVSATAASGQSVSSYTAYLNGAVCKTGLTSPSVTLIGLPANTPQCVQFTATNSKGTSPKSLPCNFRTLPTSGGGGGPAAPTLLRIDPLKITRTGATFNWTQPASSTPPIASTKFLSGSTVIATIAGLKMHAALTALTPNTAYTLAVANYDAAGHASAASNAISFRTLP